MPVLSEQIISVPVSYTHLDVYKRQRMGLMEEKYMETAVKGYQGIIDRMRHNENGVIIDNICVGTGVGGYAHYCARPTSENDRHGVGAYLIM